MVIEIKGPTALMNLTNTGFWQTDIYRNKYRMDPSLTCSHMGRSSPLLVLLDARNRSRQVIEQTEGRYVPLDLSDWAVLTYQDVLARAPFSGHPLAHWLLGQ